MRCHFSQSLLRLLCIVIAFPGCEYQLPQIEETTRQTYEQYKASYQDDLLDPIGASDISSCTAFEGDGYDEWWRFTVTHADFTNIAAAVATCQQGPKELAFSNDGSIPHNWHPGAQIPTWWTLPTQVEVTCIFWCFGIGEADRHHGWFLVHDPRSDVAYIWHWNHQWSSGECSYEQLTNP